MASNLPRSGLSHSCLVGVLVLQVSVGADVPPVVIANALSSHRGTSVSASGVAAVVAKGLEPDHQKLVTVLSHRDCIRCGQHPANPLCVAGWMEKGDDK